MSVKRARKRRFWHREMRFTLVFQRTSTPFGHFLNAQKRRFFGKMGSVAKRCGKSIQSCTFASMETTLLAQLARIVLPGEILERFEIVQIETDEEDIDSMSMTIHLDERMNAEYQADDGYESLGFMEAVSVTDFPIRDHKVVLKLRRRRWKNKQTGESFVEKISVTEKGTRYSKEFAAFLKETYGDIPSDLPYA